MTTQYGINVDPRSKPPHTLILSVLNPGAADGGELQCVYDSDHIYGNDGRGHTSSAGVLEAGPPAPRGAPTAPALSASDAGSSGARLEGGDAMTGGMEGSDAGEGLGVGADGGAAIEEREGANDVWDGLKEGGDGLGGDDASADAFALFGGVEGGGDAWWEGILGDDSGEDMDQPAAAAASRGSSVQPLR